MLVVLVLNAYSRQQAHYGKRGMARNHMNGREARRNRLYRGGSSFNNYSSRHGTFSNSFLDISHRRKSNNSSSFLQSPRSFDQGFFRERYNYYDFGGLDLGGDAWGWGWWSPIAPYGAIGVGVGCQRGGRATPYTWGGVGYVPLY